MQAPRWMTILAAMAAAAFGCSKAPTPPPQPTITVFAAASTTDVITEAAKQFEKRTGTKVQCSFDSSSTLAKQIKSGAPASVFLSADEKWMDDVQTAGMIDPDSRIDLLGNELVVIAHRSSHLRIEMDKSFDFPAAIKDVSKIAVGDPTHVPAGIYAKEALEHMKWWDAVQDRLLPAQDVRAALRLVESGEAELGIVYATDAKASFHVAAIGTFPADCHEPIRYPIAACKGAPPQAAEFIDFLRSAQMQQVFQQRGFMIVK